MDPLRLFGLSVLLSFVAWGLVGRWYWRSKLAQLPLTEALKPLLLLHSFRFIGLAFLVPGVVSPDLPRAFAAPAAYGDLIAALLALAALAGIALLGRLGIAVVWIFSLWGTADLLYAFYQGLVGVGVDPGLLGSAYFIPTVVVPLLLITHGMVFVLLLRPEGAQLSANASSGTH
jgi:hypothetical protein